MCLSIAGLLYEGVSPIYSVKRSCICVFRGCSRCHCSRLTVMVLKICVSIFQYLFCLVTITSSFRFLDSNLVTVAKPSLLKFLSHVHLNYPDKNLHLNNPAFNLYLSYPNLRLYLNYSNLKFYLNYSNFKSYLNYSTFIK